MTDTYGDLVTRTRDRLDEDSARQWSDLQLIRWLYDGAKDVSRKAECLRATAQIQATAGTQQYTMPSDVVRIHRVDYAPENDNQNVPLEYRDFDSMDSVWWTQQTVAQQTPGMYTTWGFPPNLYLVAYPTPPDAGVFNVYYYKVSTSPLVDSNGAAIASPELESVELPTGWTDLAVEYAEYCALRRDADPRWQEAKSLYDEHFADIMVTATRFVDQAGVIAENFSFGGVPRFIWDEGYV